MLVESTYFRMSENEQFFPLDDWLWRRLWLVYRKVHGSFSTFEWMNRRRCCSILARPEHERGHTELSENRSIRRSWIIPNRIYALLILGENRLILLWFCASGLSSASSFPLLFLFLFVFPGFFLRKLKENLYEIVYVLRPVYTGDFCCYFSGDFCCDFKRDFTSKLLAIQIAAESPVVYTTKSHLKSQQKSPLKLQQNSPVKTSHYTAHKLPLTRCKLLVCDCRHVHRSLNDNSWQALRWMHFTFLCGFSRSRLSTKPDLKLRFAETNLALWNSFFSSSDRQNTSWLHSCLHYWQIWYDVLTTKSIDRSSSLAALLVLVGVIFLRA